MHHFRFIHCSFGKWHLRNQRKKGRRKWLFVSFLLTFTSISDVLENRFNFIASFNIVVLFVLLMLLLIFLWLLSLHLGCYVMCFMLRIRNPKAIKPYAKEMKWNCLDGSLFQWFFCYLSMGWLLYLNLSGKTRFEWMKKKLYGCFLYFIVISYISIFSIFIFILII